MPRRAPVPDTEETLATPQRVRRAPRKKAEPAPDTVTEAVVATASIGAAPLRRKAPVRRVAAPASATEAPSAAYASTAPSAGGSARPGRSNRQLFVVLGALVVGIGVSAAIGLSDRGKIDVAARIQEQSQLIANQTSGVEGGAVQTIPVQSTPVDVPNGGLVPAGAPPPPPPPPPEPATTTASTTDEIASSTAEVAREDVPDAASEVSDSSEDEVPVAQ